MPRNEQPVYHYVIVVKNPAKVYADRLAKALDVVMGAECFWRSLPHGMAEVYVRVRRHAVTFEAWLFLEGYDLHAARVQAKPDWAEI